MTMSEKILTAFLWCSIASSVLVVWNGTWVSLKSMASILLEFLSIFKIFGITLLIIVSVGIAIAVWEQVIDKSNLWNKPKSPENQPTPSSVTDKKSSRSPISAPGLSKDKRDDRSIVPIIVVFTALAFVALSDASIYYSSNQKASPAKPLVQREEPTQTHKTSCTLINTSVIQFSSAILTLAIVIGFIVFNKDEYHVWKARRRLTKHNRRRAREESNL